MRKVFLFIIIGLCLVSFPVLARGTEEALAADDVVGPQYGGELTIWGHRFQANEPPNPSIEAGVYSGLYWLDWIQETPIVGDLETYGPRGTGKYAFNLYYGIPNQYLTGSLAERWEVNFDRLVFTVRQGVMWHNVPHVMTDGSREMTAEDFALDLIEFWKSTWNARFKGIIKDIHVSGDWEVTVEIDEFTHALLYYLGYEDRALISPPEQRIAGNAQWENQVGTGPWMFEGYLPGTEMSFVRNPDYWRTTTIDGQEYQLPFIDRVVLPIIPDQGTQIAALRSGGLDYYNLVPRAHWQTLDREHPDLKSVAFATGRAEAFQPRLDEAPGNNLMVRRALNIGTDRQQFRQFVDAEEMPEHFFPIVPDHPAYVPLDKLPKDVQELYTYDPDKAKRLLAEAGYPNGFEYTVHISDNDASQDYMSLLADQWAKIGVNLKLEIHDQVSLTALIYPFPKPKYSGSITMATAAEPILYFAQHWRSGGSGGSANRGVYESPEFDTLVDGIMNALDEDERLQLIKKASLKLQQDAVNVPLMMIGDRNYYWPWVQNYYGEVTVTDDAAFADVAKFMWIDQNMKKKMGF